MDVDAAVERDTLWCCKNCLNQEHNRMECNTDNTEESDWSSSESNTDLEQENDIVEMCVDQTMIEVFGQREAITDDDSSEESNECNN